MILSSHKRWLEMERKSEPQRKEGMLNDLETTELAESGNMSHKESIVGSKAMKNIRYQISVRNKLIDL